MFFKKRNKPIFSIQYYSNTEYDIEISNNISNNDITNIASFIFLLTYSSPISVDIIDKLKNFKNNTTIDKVLNSWAMNYINDKHKPMIEPLLAFKQNVK